MQNLALGSGSSVLAVAEGCQVMFLCLLSSYVGIMQRLSRSLLIFFILCTPYWLQLTIWDLRMKEKGGCVHRICGSVGDNLYAVCNSSKGAIAAGGADRSVTFYDPRRLSPHKSLFCF